MHLLCYKLLYPLTKKFICLDMMIYLTILYNGSRLLGHKVATDKNGRNFGHLSRVGQSTEPYQKLTRKTTIVESFD